jgi:hypothetical protein
LNSFIKSETNLGRDGDAALLFEVNGIHGAFVRDISTALTEKSVHESCLAVIDMSDDGDVAEAAGVGRYGGVGGDGGSGRESAGEETIRR